MKRFAAVLSCVAVGVLAVSLAVPAHADEIGPAPDYILTVSGDNIGDVGEVTLSCDPVGGTHPHAREACAAIEEAGSIARTEGYGGMCPDVYDPVYASAEGLETYGEGFTNHCFLLAARGVVFDF